MCIETRLSMRSKLPRAGNVGSTASQGTEMHDLVSFAQRNRKRFIHMHATNGIAHQPPRTARGLRWRRGSGSILLRGGPSGLRQRAENTAKKPHAPGNHEQPKQKPSDASKKCHGSQNPFGTGSP